MASYTRTPDSSYILEFTDGSTANADVLIGADGVRSAVRRTLFHKLTEQEKHTPGRFSPEVLHKTVEPQWSGTLVYRSLIQPQRLREKFPDHPIFKSKAPISVNYLLLPSLKIINRSSLLESERYT